MNIPLFQAQSVKVGDIEKDSSGKKIAEIVNLQVYDTPQSVVTKKDIYVKLRLLVKINSRSGELEYKNKIIKVGSPVEFRFNSGLIAGKIAELGGKEEKIEIKTITIKLYDQWPWFADSIEVGAGETDEKGEKIIKVLSKEVKPAEITVTTQNGQTVITTDLRKVDVTLTAKIQLANIKNQYVFRQDQRIIIGELISFNAGSTRIKDGYIVDIK